MKISTYPLLDGDRRHDVPMESCFVKYLDPVLFEEFTESPRFNGACMAGPYPPKLCDFETLGLSSCFMSTDCIDTKY